MRFFVRGQQNSVFFLAFFLNFSHHDEHYYKLSKSLRALLQIE